MPSGLKGYNIYLDGVKLNEFPISDLASFTIPNATPGTNYSERIVVTAVDNAGNENESGKSVKDIKSDDAAAVTQELPESEDLSQDIRYQIDAMVATKMKPTAGKESDGCLVGISTPDGDYYQAYGGDRTPNKPLTLDLNFRYGSCSKMFCHTLILREIDLGHIAWDDAVDQFVSGIPNGDEITVRQLLLFQDGLKDWLADDPATQQTYFLNSTATFDPLAYIRASAPMFEPGMSSKYSNSATFVLGAILEWCDAEYGTGRDIRQIILDEWKGEVGLDSLHWPTTNLPNAPYVRGWTPNLALPQIQSMLGPFAFLAGLFGYPTSKDLEWSAVSTTWSGISGALAGNMADFVKFGKALHEGVFLSDEMKVLQKELFTNYVSYVPAGEYQGPGWMGFGLNAIRWGSWRGWVGNLGGYIAVLFYKETDGSVIGLMLNNFIAHADCVDLFYQIAHLLDPGSTQHVPWHYRPDPPMSAREVLAPQVKQVHEPGDIDGNTKLPIKLPFNL